MGRRGRDCRWCGDGDRAGGFNQDRSVLVLLLVVIIGISVLLGRRRVMVMSPWLFPHLLRKKSSAQLWIQRNSRHHTLQEMIRPLRINRIQKPPRVRQPGNSLPLHRTRRLRMQLIQRRLHGLSVEPAPKQRLLAIRINGRMIRRRRTVLVVVIRSELAVGRRRRRAEVSSLVVDSMMRRRTIGGHAAEETHG